MGSAERADGVTSGSEQAGEAAAEAGPRRFVTFWPRRWRIFVRMLPVTIPIYFGVWAILHWVLGWLGWGSLCFVFAWQAAFLAYHALRQSHLYAVSVSESAVHPTPGWHRPRLIPLANLDRVRSARRGPYDRIFGQQHLYSTSGQKVILFRAAFDPSDLRRLLALLQLD